MRAIVVALAWLSRRDPPPRLLVKEVGSFIAVTPKPLVACRRRNRVLAGAPAIKVDPNGEFEVEQMYFLRQTGEPKRKVRCCCGMAGGFGRDLGDKPDGSGLQQFFLNAGYDNIRRIPSNAPRLMGALSGNLQTSRSISEEGSWSSFRIGRL